MAANGKIVKYIIDADTSGFTRGMQTAAAEADVAGTRIDRSLTRTTKRSKNNFKDIRQSAQTAASSIRNFGVAFQGFNTTSLIIGVTALSGIVLELAGAVAAAGTTLSIIAPIMAQGVATSSALKSGLYGLSEAFSAIAKNDGKAFTESLSKLGPAATSVAFAVAGLNKVMNSVRLNTQQALLDGIGNTLLQLGANTLPTVNAGFQVIGSSLNRAFKQAAALAGSPVFNGVLAKVFSDTAGNIDILSKSLGPIFTIFANLYGITAPYVQLLSEFIVRLTESGAAYLSSAKGAAAFNASLAHGVIALQQLGSLAGASIGFLVAIFRTSVASGNSLIGTLTGLIRSMTDWVNSAKGQAQLAALFTFTAMAVRAVASAVGIALTAIFNLIQGFSSLNPLLQTMIVNFLGSALVLRPLLTYLSVLYQSVKLLGITIFNIIQQAGVVIAALGGVASMVIALAAGLIILGAIIKGPLGSAFIIVGIAMGTFIVLNYLLSLAASVASAQLLGLATSSGFAAAGLAFAGRAALFLQAALIPLLVLAAGVLIILSMLGVFAGKAKGAQTASTGLGGSLGALQKSLKGVGASGSKTSGGGLSALTDSLNGVGDASAAAAGGLASFDKMNVLTDSAASGAGISGMPKLPDLGGVGGGGIDAPMIDTADFDKAISDMTGSFDGLAGKFDAGFSNPFDAIGKFISANPVPFFIAFAVILAIIIARFVTGAVAIGLTTLPLTLIVIAIIAIIAIIVLLVQNWSTVWGFIQNVVQNVGTFITNLFTAVGQWIGDVLTGIGNFFGTIFNGIVEFIKRWGITILAVMFLPFSLLLGLIITFKDEIFAFFSAIVDFIVSVFTPVGEFFKKVFSAAWEGIKFAFSLYVAYFRALFNGLATIFSPVVRFFVDIFTNAWNGIKTAFSAVAGFFRGVWDTITSIFGSIGTAIGDAIGGAFKNIINSILRFAVGKINGFIDAINAAISLINKIPGVDLTKVGRLPVPQLAKGGVVSSRTFAEIGENGAEAVMPLENNTGWIDKLADKINSSNGQNGGQPIQLTVQIGEDKVATKIIQLINEKTQMSGRNSILV